MQTQEPKTRERFAQKNLRMAFEHLQDIFDNPGLLDEIPDDVTLIYLPDDDPELSAFNRDLGALRESEERTVIYRRVTTSAPHLTLDTPHER